MESVIHLIIDYSTEVLGEYGCVILLFSLSAMRLWGSAWSFLFAR